MGQFPQDGSKCGILILFSSAVTEQFYFYILFILLLTSQDQGQGLASDHQTDALVQEIKGWKERRVLHIMTLRPMSSCQCQCQCQWGMGKVLHQTDALVQEMKGWKERKVTRWITDLGLRSYTTQTCTLSRPSSICIKTNNQTRRTHGNEGRCKGQGSLFFPKIIFFSKTQYSRFEIFLRMQM